jgi:hypothetical protein
VRDVRVGRGGIVIDCVGGGLLDFTFDFARVPSAPPPIKPSSPSSTLLNESARLKLRRG